MAPLLHCVRHAQGLHNLGPQYHGVQDPKLTPTGEAQCLALKLRHFQDQSNIALIAASPLSRTLHTASIVFQPALVVGKKILAIPETQETSDLLCDTGFKVTDLVKRCDENHWPADLHLLDSSWNVKTLGSRYSPASRAVEARARDARRLLRNKFSDLMAAGNQNPEVVLVTHGGFLHYFTGDWENANKFDGTGWDNCETRVYTYEMGIDHDDVEARLSETVNSRHNRGLDYSMYTLSKQQELFEITMLERERKALQNAGAVSIGAADHQASDFSVEQGLAVPLISTNSGSVEAEV